MKIPIEECNTVMIQSKGGKQEAVGEKGEMMAIVSSGLFWFCYLGILFVHSLPSFV